MGEGRGRHVSRVFEPSGSTSIGPIYVNSSDPFYGSVWVVLSRETSLWTYIDDIVLDDFVLDNSVLDASDLDDSDLDDSDLDDSVLDESVLDDSILGDVVLDAFRSEKTYQASRCYDNVSKET